MCTAIFILAHVLPIKWHDEVDRNKTFFSAINGREYFCVGVYYDVRRTSEIETKLGGVL
jgi:hypothetical protein